MPPALPFFVWVKKFFIFRRRAYQTQELFSVKRGAAPFFKETPLRRGASSEENAARVLRRLFLIAETTKAPKKPSRIAFAIKRK